MSNDSIKKKAELCSEFRAQRSALKNSRQKIPVNKDIITFTVRTHTDSMS